MLGARSCRSYCLPTQFIDLDGTVVQEGAAGPID